MIKVLDGIALMIIGGAISLFWYYLFAVFGAYNPPPSPFRLFFVYCPAWLVAMI